MCEGIEIGCHTVELWMPASILILGTFGFLFVFLTVRFLARSIPAVGI